MGTSELRCERRGVPLVERRFDRRDAGDDIEATDEFERVCLVHEKEVL